MHDVLRQSLQTVAQEAEAVATSVAISSTLMAVIQNTHSGEITVFTFDCHWERLICTL